MFISGMRHLKIYCNKKIIIFQGHDEKNRNDTLDIVPLKRGMQTDCANNYTYYPVKLYARAPGARLLSAAEFMFPKNTYERVFLPIIQDMRKDYFDALSTGRKLKARWVRFRGSWAFAMALILLVVAGVRNW